MNDNIQRLEHLTNKLETPSKVLVVEDDVSTGKIISSMIEECGLQAVLVNTIEDGLNVIKSDNIDLILLDMVFPGHDGIDFLNQIRRESGHPPTVVVSGICSESFLNAVKEIFPVISCMAKPVEIGRIKEMLGAFNLKRVKKNG